MFVNLLQKKGHITFCSALPLYSQPHPSILATEVCCKDYVWQSLLTLSRWVADLADLSSLVLAKGWEMTDVHLGRKSHPELGNGNPQIQRKITWYINPPLSGQITRAGWQDKAISPKSTHCTSCISTPLDPSLGFLGQAQHDADLFLLRSSASDPRSGNSYSTTLQM